MRVEWNFPSWLKLNIVKHHSKLLHLFYAKKKGLSFKMTSWNIIQRHLMEKASMNVYVGCYKLSGHKWPVKGLFRLMNTQVKCYHLHVHFNLVSRCRMLSSAAVIQVNLITDCNSCSYWFFKHLSRNCFCMFIISLFTNYVSLIYM